ncbi:hypothetical protein GXM_05993 [Nostoc sphaeroides CCNUC1]|uniref:Uncharacterized protein n=1 Tax=Nostoc sphaeroides CCNUC1 TaxID=2653204 RepID=A0A5P8W959_9NOSO|nr:hypothetical protein GXM_05993 [Nostoc sphaeroides CCNUC1]
MRKSCLERNSPVHILHSYLNKRDRTYQQCRLPKVSIQQFS